MTTLPIAANPLQPLIDAFDWVLVGFHDTVGLSWGMSIIALTVVVRTLLIPLTLKQFKSMQSLQRLAPEIKALQEKYKDDKQRQQQEMMKFYQENKVNPFGSCLPLVLQMPVFFSLFYMLRKDLKIDICGPEAVIAAKAHEVGKTITTIGCQEVKPGSAHVRLHPRPDVPRDRRRADRAAGPLRRLAAALERPDVGHGRPQPALHHDRAAVRVRAVHPELPGRPARLLDHDQPLDGGPAVPHQARRGHARPRGPRRRGRPGRAAAAVAEPKAKPEKREQEKEPRAGGGERQGHGRRRPRPARAARRRRPRPAQRKKKKTGRRR